MDLYLKNNDYKRASLVAHEVMLQEMNENEMTLSACLLSCMKYLAENKTDPEPTETNENQSEKKVSNEIMNALNKKHYIQTIIY
jgi:hypothetical protein